MTQYGKLTDYEVKGQAVALHFEGGQAGPSGGHFKALYKSIPFFIALTDRHGREAP
ncbi:MAG: hypothetical protein HFH93_10500 [Lachnospiraceae bacterium]|nr:hypothetical protein [Lachnospiraceae bacterium]